MSEIDVREEKLGLVELAAAPSIWAVHFLLSYGTAAVWCAKVAGPDGALSTARWAIAAYTAAALAGITALGVRGWRRHRVAGGALPHDDDSPEDRTRFLGFATVLLAGLSAVATLYPALTIVFVETCR